MSDRTGRTWIENRSGRRPRSLVREAWRGRELVLYFGARDLRLRYQQTFLGVVWVALQSLVTTAVLTLAFNRIGGIEAGDGTPYPLFALAGFVMWTYFASAQSQCSESLTSSAAMLTRIAFPRMTAPLGALLPPLVDLAIATVFLETLALVYGRTPSWSLLLFPLVVVLLALVSAGFGLWLSALNVRYRDVRYALPTVLQLGLFVSPVAYPATSLSGAARDAYYLNPMAGLVGLGRWSLLGGPAPDPRVGLSLAVGLVVLVGGLWYFARAERELADVV